MLSGNLSGAGFFLTGMPSRSPPVYRCIDTGVSVFSPWTGSARAATPGAIAHLAIRSKPSDKEAAAAKRRPRAGDAERQNAGLKYVAI